MKYTPKQRQGIAKAFKAAKKYLKKRDDKEHYYNYICYCISEAVDHKKIGDANGENAKQVIRSAIYPYAYANTWANKNGFNGNMQEWRHAWLDRLIKEFES